MIYTTTAHKIYNATVHCLLAKKAGKKFVTDTGAGYAWKELLHLHVQQTEI